MGNIKKIGVYTSGGDAPGMNACIRAVARTAIHHNIEVVGIRRGYSGMIDGDFQVMNRHSVSNIIQRGGTILKTSRSERFLTPEGREVAYNRLREAGVDALVCIGGDGSYAGAHTFYQQFGMPIVGAPGTIDNDLYGTDYTIGYDTALNTAVDALDKIRNTADSHNRLFLVEVMGRDAGYIALNCGIAGGAEAVLIPEQETSIEQLIEKLESGKRHNKTSSIIVVAEGNKSGNAIEISNQINERFDYYDTRVVILGHVQRGGVPTCRDRVMASRLGHAAVETLMDGLANLAVGFDSNEIVHTSFAKATKLESEMDLSTMGLVDILSG